MKTVGIVGGGFCGTVVAAQLLRRSGEPIRVCLFDRSGVFGAGIAYATDEPHHFLNVPATNMSAFQDEPAHFAQWLAGQGIDPGDGFLPRRVYRRYLQSLLTQPPKNPESELRFHSDAVVAIEEGLQLRTASDRIVRFDEVVIATGYSLSSRFKALSPFAPDTWPSSIRDAIVIGSGLTALDGAASVFARFPDAQVRLLSRHGAIPESFRSAPPFSVSPSPSSVRALVLWLRHEIDRAGDWVPVFDAMRPQWEDLWQGFSLADRRQFLRHLRPIFDRYRHRVPPGQAAALAPFWVSGRLQIERAEVVMATPTRVMLRNGSTREADLVLDATGFAKPHDSDQLLGQLIADGRLKADPLALGVLPVSDDPLQILGPPLRGRSWETTAVPELRRQAQEICKAILGDQITEFAEPT